MAKYPTYTEHPQYLKPRAQRKARARGTAQNAVKGVTKWINGRPQVFYHRIGYEWVNGSYIKTGLKASGLTMRYGSNRQARRADDADTRRKARRKRRAQIQEQRQARLGLLER